MCHAEEGNGFAKPTAGTSQYPSRGALWPGGESLKEVLGGQGQVRWYSTPVSSLLAARSRLFVVRRPQLADWVPPDVAVGRTPRTGCGKDCP